MKLNDIFDEIEHDQTIIECFRQLWQHSADLMFIMAVEDDGEFSLYDNNPASRNVVGISLDEPVHRLNLRNIWDDDIVEGLYATYRRAVNAGKPISQEQYAVRPDGSECYVDTLFVPIFDREGKPIFVCGVSRDVTSIREAERVASDAQAKLAEYNEALEEINQRLDIKVQERTEELEKARLEAEEATEAKSLFLAKMSHEIRTPINAVLGLSQLAMKTPMTVEQLAYLSKIKAAGDVLLNIVNDVLDFSKLEAGKFQLEKTAFDPEEVAINALQICQLKAWEKGLQILLNVHPAMPAELSADPLRLQQILTNLISNAIKFTPAGWVSVELQYDATNQTLCCWVKDSGIGISEDSCKTLFESFSQADDSMSRRYGGTGLGLAICKQLADAMDGSIAVTSEVGKGTVFTVCIPAAPLSTPLVENIDHSSLRVMIIADNEMAREKLAEKLRFSGCLVTVVKDPVAAEGIARNEKSNGLPFDVVLMDWTEPTMLALRIAEMLYRDDLAKRIIIMESSYDHQEVTCDDAMDICFLEKPVSIKALLAALDLKQQAKPVGEVKPWLTPGAISAPDFSAYRVLLAEDNPINTEVALGYLQETGVTVDAVENGLEVLEKLKHERYDLILMDIQMPELDGLSTAQRIRKNTVYEDLPIVAMTAHAMFGAQQKSLAAGMNEHISKPVSPETLYKVMAQFLISRPTSSRRKYGVVSGGDSSSILQVLGGIAELDVAKALRNMGGNTDLYVGLIKRFYQRYSQDVSVLKALFDGAVVDGEKASDAMHSLKSSASYLGAFQLSDYCGYLERQLSENTLPDKGLIAEIFSTLETILCQFEQLPFVQSHVLAVPESGFSVENFHSALGELYPLLCSSDLLAEEYMPPLLKMVAGTPHYETIIELESYVNEVEYELAAELVKKMLQTLSLKSSSKNDYE